jgi:hypothetical protein
MTADARRRAESPRVRVRPVPRWSSCGCRAGGRRPEAAHRAGLEESGGSCKSRSDRRIDRPLRPEQSLPDGWCLAQVTQAVSTAMPVAAEVSGPDGYPAGHRTRPPASTQLVLAATTANRASHAAQLDPGPGRCFHRPRAASTTASLVGVRPPWPPPAAPAGIRSGAAAGPRPVRARDQPRHLALLHQNGRNRHWGRVGPPRADQRPAAQRHDPASGAGPASRPPRATPAYVTALAVFRALQGSYAPQWFNIVVLRTDGINDDPTGGINRAELLSRLKAELQKDRPVRIGTSPTAPTPSPCCWSCRRPAIWPTSPGTLRTACACSATRSPNSRRAGHPDQPDRQG